MREYELIFKKDTSQSKLELKESFHYEKSNFNNADEVCKFMKEKYCLHQKSDEYVYMLAFNNRMKLIGVFEIGHGTGDKCLMDARGIFMRAVYIGAKYIIMIHNHPSGDVEPSEDDKTMNRKIKDAGELMDIFMVDNIIMGRNSFYSFQSLRESKYIEV